MTKLLRKALDAASALPEPEQDALAEMLLQELVTERQWDEAFARSQDALARLADEALEEFRAGRTEPLE